MAITKVSRGLLSTGISDSSDSTAITIDSSENVGIGETTPIVPLHISKDSASGENIALLLDNNNTTTGSEIGMLFRSYVGSTNTDFQITAIANGANDMDLTFASDGGTERMRIDSSGNIGIGTASPANLLSLYKYQADTDIRLQGSAGSYYITNDYSDNALTFIHDSTERMRIDSSGNVGIGTNSPAEKLEVNGNIKFGDGHTIGDGAGDNLTLVSSAAENIVLDSTGGITVISSAGTERMRVDASGHLMLGKTNSSAGNAGTYLGATGSSFFTLDSSSSVNTLHVYDQVDSAYRFYVRGTGSIAGTIFATVTSISSTSDERLKENIKDLETGLTEIMALKPRRFDWKEGEGNGTKNNAGFIAQEIETVLPDLVGDYLHKELDDVKSVRMGDILPTLVKAVQEQQALIETQQTTIDDFKSRIETLEAGE